MVDQVPTSPPQDVFDPAKAHLATAPIGHHRQLLRARYTHDGRLIIAGGMDQLLHVWETGSGRHYSLAGHRTWISALEVDPHSSRAFTADFRGTICGWDASQENAAPLLTIAADRGITRALAVSPDGLHLVSAGDDAIVRVWRAADGAPVREMSGHRAGIYAVAVHPDGKHLVTGDLFGRVMQWEFESGRLVREFDARLLHTRKEDFLADVGGVRCIAFNHGGALMACGGLSKAESNAFCPGAPLVMVFDWESGLKRNELSFGFKSDGPVNGLCFLPDGTLAGCGEHLNAPTALVFWKVDQGEPFHKVPADSAYDLDLHPDGRTLLAPAFKAMGAGGNGARKEHKEKYLPNGAQLLVCNLWENRNLKGKP